MLGIGAAVVVGTKDVVGSKDVVGNEDGLAVGKLDGS